MCILLEKMQRKGAYVMYDCEGLFNQLLRNCTKLNLITSKIYQMQVDKSKLTFRGSMNYIVQIFANKDNDKVIVDKYQPRKNKIWTGELTAEELRPQVEETIERMKIAIIQMQEYLDGTRETVYYWQEDGQAF